MTSEVTAGIKTNGGALKGHSVFRHETCGKGGDRSEFPFHCRCNPQSFSVSGESLLAAEAPLQMDLRGLVVDHKGAPLQNPLYRICTGMGAVENVDVAAHCCRVRPCCWCLLTALSGSSSTMSFTCLSSVSLLPWTVARKRSSFQHGLSNRRGNVSMVHVLLVTQLLSPT